MNIRNEDIEEVLIEAPEGHKHLRTIIRLKNGEEIILQEAAIANIARAYMTIKTHPVKRSVTLKGGKVENQKEGYAEWQLLEDEREDG